jgi:hypothetical protein
MACNIGLVVSLCFLSNYFKSSIKLYVYSVSEIGSLMNYGTVGNVIERKKRAVFRKPFPAYYKNTLF